MRLMALDVGERWVGIAISDPTATLARPLRGLERASRADDFSAIQDLIERHDVERVVVGQPLNMDGSEGPQARRVAHYAEALAAHLSVPVVFWDERLSTEEAEQVLLQTRSKRDRRRARSDGELDAIAAAVILQEYLDSRLSTGGDREEQDR